MASRLESAMETLISVFHSYSGKEGDKYKLNTSELKLLLQNELKGFTKKQKDPKFLDDLMLKLDENKDGEVDFNEYVSLVASLTIACNDFFEEYLKKTEQKKH
uniref:protein S100-A1-like n=1 Tax=Myxine glutinosa TaxID=7769 RepID=UPI00358F4FA7